MDSRTRLHGDRLSVRELSARGRGMGMGPPLHPRGQREGGNAGMTGGGRSE